MQSKRPAFDKAVAAKFGRGVELPGADWTSIQGLVEAVSGRLLSAAEVKGRVARNEALRDTVFFMTITAQLGIPLFAVGKPGSSKSLAKTIVMESMKVTIRRLFLFADDDLGSGTEG